MLVKKIYNFSYRLSGSEKIAGVLTEHIFSNSRSKHQDNLALYKKAWEEFSKYYGYVDLKGEDAVQRVLLLLVPDLRCVVILRDIMGCSYDMIAAILDKPVSEVAKLVSDGRSQFIKLYKNSNIIS